MNSREVIAFRKKIEPLEEIEISERVKANGTLENIKFRFYLGQELQLKVMIFIRHKGNKVQYPYTVAGGGEYYIAGDDDVFNFDVVIPIQNDDEIVCKVINLSEEWDYNLVCDVDIDYYGGNNRIVGGVIGG